MLNTFNCHHICSVRRVYMNYVYTAVVTFAMHYLRMIGVIWPVIKEKGHHSVCCNGGGSKPTSLNNKPSTLNNLSVGQTYDLKTKEKFIALYVKIFSDLNLSKCKMKLRIKDVRSIDQLQFTIVVYNLHFLYGKKQKIKPRIPRGNDSSAGNSVNQVG